MGVEVGSVERDGLAHGADELVALLIESRQDNAFEFVVERGRVALSAVGWTEVRVMVADGPAGDVFDAAFDPPSVEHAEAWHAVESGLHAAGAGGFQRGLRCVEPDIHSGDKEPRQLPVVVVEVNDFDFRLPGAGNLSRGRFPG